MAAEQLSGTIVVIIIAICVQGVIMVFIFAKRQIMRFALRNRSGPHAHFGHGAPKPLRREADRCLDYISFIRHEPQIRAISSNPEKPEGHFHRAKALEAFAAFEKAIAGYSLNYTRLPGSNVRSFLLRCTNGPLIGIDSHELHLLCDEYEHARHHFEEFGPKELEAFLARLNGMSVTLEANRAVKPHPSPMPLGGTSSPNPRSKRRKNQGAQQPVATSGRGDNILSRNKNRRSSRAMLIPTSGSGVLGSGSKVTSVAV